ncbi:MAG: undecaprenyl diphosphate synthase family protein, partial [Alphaproteobacteria bacterium]|nr:undecaprenyl diphosphate synthase family protein [Alphaproteobacteria bacterium]
MMDGNRRWAKKHMMPSAAGHNKGAETLIEI